MNRTVAIVAAPLAVVLAGGIGLAARQDSDGPGPGEARLEVDGEAEVTRAGGATERVTGGEDLATGDVVRLTDGTGTLELHRGVVLHVRAGREGAGDSRVRVDQVPELLGGEVLAEAGDDPARVEADDTALEADGVARLHQGLRLSAAVYRGTGRLQSAGQEPEVGPLRQVSVATLGNVSVARPVALDPGDPWDRRVLSEVLELDRELARRAAGFTNQVSDRAEGAVFFRSRYTSLGDGVWDDLRADRDAGENLVGLGIVSLGDRDSDVERLRRVFEHRATRVGGRQPGWGVVAGLEGVDGDELLSLLDDVVDGSAVELALAAVDGGSAGPDGGPASGGAGDSPTPPGGTSADPGGDDGGQPPGGDDPGGPTPPTVPPPTIPPPTVPPPTIPPPTVPPPTVPPGPGTTITDTVDDVVDDVTQVIDDTADEVDDLLGGLLP